MTKFGHYLQSLERDCPPCWRGKFIKYKQLKKILKKCKTQDSSPQSIDQQAEDAFFNELQSQLISTSHHFEAGSKAILNSYHSIQRRSTFSFLAACIRCTSLSKSKSSSATHRRTADLAEQAYWCRKYARANAVALRKILKKHDKLCENSKGRAFLAECWAAHPRSQAGTAGMFLHSPLLDELLAVQSVLQTRLAQYQECASEENVKNNNNNDDDDGDDNGAVNGQHGTDTDGDGGGRRKERMVAVHRPLSKADDTDTDSMHGGILSSANLQRFDEQNNQQQQQPQDQDISAASHHSSSHRHGDSVPTNNNNNTHHEQQQQQDTMGEGSEMTDATDNSYMHTTTASAGCPSTSLYIQRQLALQKMQECPTFLLDTSDFEWASTSTDVRGGGGGQRLGGGDGGGQGQGGGEKSASKKSFLLGTPGFVLREEQEEEEEEDANEGGGSGERIKNQDDDDDGDRGMIGEEDAAATCGISSFSADDLKCPICLDIMYKPVGLACGHKFCRQCALESAGFGHAIGAFHNIISYVPRKTPCPQCRQVGVYEDAVALKELGNLIESRFPEEYVERAVEDKARRREKAQALVAAAASLGRRRRRGRRGGGLSPYDFFLGNAVAE